MKHLRTALRVCAGVCLCASTSQRPRRSQWPQEVTCRPHCNNAQPGDTISLARGAVFTGSFVLPNKGGSSMITSARKATRTCLAPAGASRRRTRRCSRRSSRQRRAGDSDRRGRASLDADAARDRRHRRQRPGDARRRLRRSVAAVAGRRTTSSSTASTSTATRRRARSAASRSTARRRRSPARTSPTSRCTARTRRRSAAGTAPGRSRSPTTTSRRPARTSCSAAPTRAIPNLVPSDITISGNLIQQADRVALAELGRRRTCSSSRTRAASQLRGNNFDYNWQGGQTGYAVLFTVRNQDGGCPWCQVDHVTFEQNVVRHVGGRHPDSRLRRQHAPEPADERDRHPQQPLRRHRQPALGRQRLLRCSSSAARATSRSITTRSSRTTAPASCSSTAGPFSSSRSRTTWRRRTPTASSARARASATTRSARSCRRRRSR